MGCPDPIVIVGGGLGGSLAALALHHSRPEVPILLLESGPTFGGDHTWSFFSSDVPPGSVEMVQLLRPRTWPTHRVHFPGRERRIDIPYNTVQSAALDRVIRMHLPPGKWRTGAKVANLTGDSVELEGGETLLARAVIDARGPQGPMPGLTLGWQKFVGVELASTSPDPECAIVMDATVDQIGGYRFAYILPLAPQRVLVEDTYYTLDPTLDENEVVARAHAIAEEAGLDGKELRRESGVLPIVISGKPDLFWPKDDPIARLGLTGGFFHATTGYSIGLALQMAQEFARLGGEYDGPALAQWTRSRFLRHWHNMRFYRALNRMMFYAAGDEERYRIFEHFYRLPRSTIARFYAGTLTALDKARILTGKPPVVMSAALKAMVRP
ncbi:lycopene beta-cyclase CrtY [Caenibius sp. WL]|uniref:lycopene beta-cyclase CrtY n=1 Tax=Caenibius sp. WL TaxID=2872646 RepID=UPI0021BDD177|nr:lycopene beta-cyclase CrtY [Caenibius sp. WL]